MRAGQKKRVLRYALALAVAALFYGWLHLAPATVLAGQPGTVEGKVVNGTPGGLVPRDLEVVLHIEEQQGHRDETAQVDEQGGFRFKDLSLDSGASYAISTEYAGGLYGQDLGSPSATGVFEVTLTIYEASNDAGMLRASSMLLFVAGVDQESQTLRVIEHVVVENTGDRAYVPIPGTMPQLRFSLPPNPADLQVMSELVGADPIQIDRGFALTATVPPGRHQVVYSYNAPYSASSIVFRQSVPFPVGEFLLLHPKGTIKARAPEFGEPKEVMLNNTPLVQYRTQGLAAGAPLEIELSGLATAGFRLRFSPDSWLLRIGLPLALGLIGMFAVAYAFRHRRQEAEGSVTQANETAPRDRRALLTAVARLDEEYEAGGMSEEVYQRLRQSMLAEAVELGQEPRKHVGGKPG